MINNQKFDLEDRTLKFSRKLISVLSALPKTAANLVMVPQGIRSGTSVGANYREANDALGHKDFLMKIRTCRKEAKETVYWLQLLIEGNQSAKKELAELLDESEQLVKIFSTIVKRSIG